MDNNNNNNNSNNKNKNKRSHSESFKNIFAYWTVKDTNNKSQQSLNKSSGINSPQKQSTTSSSYVNNPSTSNVDLNNNNQQQQQQQQPPVQYKTNNVYKSITISSDLNPIVTLEKNNNNNVEISYSPLEGLDPINNDDGKVVGDSEESTPNPYEGFLMRSNLSETTQKSAYTIFEEEKTGYENDEENTKMDGGYNTTLSDIDNNMEVDQLSSNNNNNNVQQQLKNISISSYSTYSTIRDSSSNSYSAYTGVGGYDQNKSNYSPNSYSSGSLYSTSYKTSTPDEDGEEDEEETMDEDTEKDPSDKDKEKEKYLKQTRKFKGTGRDWNVEFQKLLRLAPSLDKFQKLTFLAMDFVKAAENYGFIIIKEMFLPNELKTIKPIDLGGIAGGQKYICQNILFKFAYDQQIGSTWLYGGKYPSELAASKAAGNELKSDHADKINVPLMCIIDYSGYRLIAISVLPISKDSLIYGSCDGGNTVHNDIQEINDIMETVGRSMNLKGHLSGINPKYIYGPGDLEIHKSKQTGDYYAVDFGRLLPPQACFDSNGGTIAHRDVFYKLFRPEFLKLVDQSLSSDAFSGWGWADPDNDRHNQEVVEATKKLYDDIIPKAAKQFEQEWKDFRGTEEEKSWDICIEAHKLGINIRHLGRIRNLITHQKLRIHILNEMAARVLKNSVKEEQRVNVSGDSIGSEEKRVFTIVEFLNKVFGVHRFETVKDFWYINVKTLFMEKFGNNNCGLSAEELSSKYDLSESLQLEVVISKFQKKTGIKLSGRVKSILEEASKHSNSSNTKKSEKKLPYILYTDVKEIRPVSKHSNMIARSEGISLYMKALELIYANQVYYGKEVPSPDYNRFKSDFNEEIGLLESCYQKLLLASRSSTTDSSLYHLLGLVNFELYKLRLDDTHIVRRAMNHLLTSIKYNPTNTTTLVSLASIHDIQLDYKSAENIYVKLLSLDPSEILPLLFESAALYSPYYSETFNANILSISCHQFFVILEILEKIGPNHPLYRQYERDVYKLVVVLIFKTYNSTNSGLHRCLENVFQTRQSMKKPTDSYGHFEDYFAPIIDQIFAIYPNIIDDFLEEAALKVSGRILFVTFIKMSYFSPVLKKRLIQFFKEHPIETFNQRAIDPIFSNEVSLKAIVQEYELSQLKYIRFYSRMIDFTKHTSLTHLSFMNISLEDDSIQLLIDGISVVQNQLLKLDMENLYCYGSHDPIIPFQLKQLKQFRYISNSIPIIFFQSIVSGSKNSLEMIHCASSQDIQDNLELLADCPLVVDLEIKSCGNLKIDFLPRSLTRINIADSFHDCPKPIEPLIARCPNLKEISIHMVDFIEEGIAPLKQVPLEKLSLYAYYPYMEKNQMAEGIEVWTSSLKDLKLFINALYPQLNSFLQSLHSLTKLSLESNHITDSNVQTILIHSRNLIDLSLSSKNYNLIANDLNDSSKLISNSSIQNLSLSNMMPKPFENFGNIGLIFPGLKRLTLDNIENYKDMAMNYMLDHMPCSLRSFDIKSCYYFSDNSLIALSNSPVAETIEEISIYDTIYISDSSYIKILESCPNLKSLRTPMVKRSQSVSFIRAKYPSVFVFFK
eukprot:gene7680-9448_t